MATASQSTFLKRSTSRMIGMGVAVIGGALIQAPAAQSAVIPSTPGTDPTAAITSFANQLPNTSLTNTTYGFEFTTSKALAVRNLGIYDSGGNGLIDSHDVGIWRKDNATALATVTATSGTSATLINGFRYVNLPSILTLQPGTYRVGAFYPSNGGGDVFAQYKPGNTTTTGSSISLGGSFDSTPSLSLIYPGNPTSASPGYFGPNFQYSEVPVPGPLPVFGAATAFGFSRRLRKRIRSNRSIG